MAEYIERDYVKDWIHAVNSTGGFKRYDDYMWLMDKVIEAEAADVQPVEHGCWIEHEIRGSLSQYCSICGSDCGVLYPYHYCPNCGARMNVIYEDDKVRAIKVTGWDGDTEC